MIAKSWREFFRWWNFPLAGSTLSVNCHQMSWTSVFTSLLLLLWSKLSHHGPINKLYLQPKYSQWDLVAVWNSPCVVRGTQAPHGLTIILGPLYHQIYPLNSLALSWYFQFQFYFQRERTNELFPYLLNCQIAVARVKFKTKRFTQFTLLAMLSYLKLPW